MKSLGSSEEAVFRLKALVEKAEEAILWQRVLLRESIPYQGSAEDMAHDLMEFLQYQSSRYQNFPAWAALGLSEILVLVDARKLVRQIWSEKFRY